MALVRWDPARELASMEIDRLHNMFSNFYNEGVSRSWVPPVDIYETAQHEVVIKAELPEMKREDISVTFENNVLTLRGEHKSEQTDERQGYRRIERNYGSFVRSFVLPEGTNVDAIDARVEHGVLTVSIPKVAEAAPRKLQVKSGGLVEKAKKIFKAGDKDKDKSENAQA